MENFPHIGETTKLFFEIGTIMLTIYISSFRANSPHARQLLEHCDFTEAYCHYPIEVYENSDVKGMYQRARDKSSTSSPSPSQLVQNSLWIRGLPLWDIVPHKSYTICTTAGPFTCRDEHKHLQSTVCLCQHPTQCAAT